MADWLRFAQADRHLNFCIVTMHKTLHLERLDQASPPAGEQIAPNLNPFYHHQASAARLLQNQVNGLCLDVGIGMQERGQVSTQQQHGILSSIALFLSVQIQESAYGAWRAHLHGAKVVLALLERARLPAPLPVPKHDAFLDFHLMTVDVFGTTTAPLTHRREEVVTEHQTYLDLLKTGRMGFDSRNSLTPVPDEILKGIIRANILRAGGNIAYFSDQGQEKKTAIGLSPVADVVLAAQRFSPETWAKLIIHSQPNPEQMELQAWELLARCFQSAATAYVILSTGTGHRHWRQAEAEAEAETQSQSHFLNAAYASLTTSIAALFKLASDSDAPSGSGSGGGRTLLHKFVLWPMVIAGVESAARGDKVFQDYLTHKLNMLTVELGTMAMREAAGFLEGLWRKFAAERQGQGAYTEVANGTTLEDGRVDVDWDGIFDAGPVFLM
ncbi:hypothetical protein BDW74DRAFT_173744 [Aspergillus multicolor]|uniref:uncharacterized protein n=1 Tax=Aspergillus multicolor TaxID=41759 RepID=UPI003CCDCE0F